jgi:hypothetical protein
MPRWKLSSIDLQSLTRWEEYSRAKDEMFVHTDIPEARWNVLEADDKRRARLNMIHHLLESIPYQHVPRDVLEIPDRPPPPATSGRIARYSSRCRTMRRP